MDLKFSNSEVLDYRTYLSSEYKTPKGTNYKNTTVNRKIDTLKSLFSFLKTNDYDVNPYVFKLKPLPDDSEGYGFLTFEESEQLAELALTEREKGLQKRLLIKLAARTSLRENALLMLKWTDIRQSYDNPDIYIIEVNDKSRQDKGKRIYKEITNIMYTELIKIKNDNEYIFDISQKYISAMMKRLVDKMGLNPARNIKFHSLKKAGVGFVKDLTNDIQAAADQAGHSSVTTTQKYYLQHKKNIAGLAMDENIPINIFKSLTHDECIDLLMSVENGLGLLLKRKAQNTINNRK